METPTIDLYRGECLAVLKNLPDNSVDAIVTDPPYGLSNTDPAKVTKALTAWVMGARDYVPEGKGFMGQAWDSFVPPPAVWDECYRVLKPGGHMAVFAGSRTQDLMGLSIRLAGFDLRDSVAWLYGSGFPKSLDVSKAIDKAAGAEREVTGIKPGGSFVGPGGLYRWGDTHMSWDDMPRQGRDYYARAKQQNVTTAATDEARKWEGWGTALKPGHEPIILARKPFPGTVAANVLEHGTGALNIDATRTGAEERPVMVRTSTVVSASSMSGASTGATSSGEITIQGRWPANVILDEDQAAALDEQSGTKKSGSRKAGTYRGIGYQGSDATEYPEVKGDEGGASRFFYVAKAGKKERPVVDGVAHPCVKPVALMRWLVRLITPPGGIILEPFAGTGTTGEAAALEGFGAIMIEAHEPYLPLIRTRMDRVAAPRA